METDISKIPTGMPLREGEPVVINNGLAFVALPDETPVAVCTVDCTTGSTGVLAPFKAD